MKAFLYSMHSHGYFDGGGSWRAITTGEGFLHTQGAAIAALTRQIEDHHFTRREQAAEGVWKYVFQADDGSRAVAVLSPAATHEEYRLPANALDLFGNPIPEGTPIGKTVCYLPLAGRFAPSAGWKTGASAACKHGETSSKTPPAIQRKNRWRLGGEDGYRI